MFPDKKYNIIYADPHPGTLKITVTKLLTVM